MRKGIWRLVGLLAVAGLILSACGGGATPEPEVIEVTRVVEGEPEMVEVTVPVETSGGNVTVLGIWGGDELSAFQEVVFPFTEETGIGMAFEGTRDLAAVLTTRFQAGNPPDLAVLQNPGQVRQFAEQGALVDLSTVLDMDQVNEAYAQSWLDINTIDGTVYGLFFKAALKSNVWYVPANFEAGGYEVPGTWDELMALSQQIIDDGGTPWCLGIESGAASGWPATDWTEDLMLRTAGPEAYDQWVNHEIPWTSDEVREAVSMFGEVARNDDMVVGGPAGVNSINFGDSPNGLFTDPPDCYMHRQASFITGFFPDDVTAEEYDFFAFPEVNPEYGTPALVSGDTLVMFNDTPEARQMLQYLATAEAQSIWAERGGFLTPNRNLDPSAYPDDLTRQQAEILTGAEVARFDASDLMPAQIGAGAFWEGMVNYVAGDDLDTVLQSIETAAADAYGE